MTEKFIEPETVGQMLKAEFLEPLKLSQNALAQAIGVPSNRINGIVNGTRGITADTDLRLTRYFGLTEGFFLRYQNAVELVKAKQKNPRSTGQYHSVPPFCSRPNFRRTP